MLRLQGKKRRMHRLRLGRRLLHVFKRVHENELRMRIQWRQQHVHQDVEHVLFFFQRILQLLLQRHCRMLGELILYRVLPNLM